MRIPRWLSPAALAAVVLCIGLALARLPEYNGGGRTTMVFVSFLASALLGGFSTLYVYVFKPRLGAATGHVLLSLVVFSLACIVAFAIPACPSDPTGARCTPTQAVANGFAMMLVALCFSIVILLWHVTKRSVQLLFRPFRSLLPSGVKSRRRSGRTKAETNVKVDAKISVKDAKAKRKPSGTHGGKSAGPTHKGGRRAARDVKK